MRHLKQTRKKNCGQTCLAMIIGIPIEEVERRVSAGFRPKRGPTNTADLVRILRASGMIVGDRLTRLHYNCEFPDFCIMKLRHRTVKKWGGHWIVMKRDGRELVYYDPALPKALRVVKYNRHLVDNNLKITSHLEVKVRGCA